MTIDDEGKLKQVIWETVHRVPVFDIHTHLYDTRFGDLMLWGIDELLTYHYLIAELFRYAPMSKEHFYEPLDYEHFYGLSKHEQANLIWAKCFKEHSPLSEAQRGVLTTLGLLGMNAGLRNLDEYRHYYESKSPEQHIDDVLRVANLEAVVMTNDPFDDREREIWEKGEAGDPRFRAALRLDALLLGWEDSYQKLKAWGYKVKKRLDKTVYPEVERFLKDWVEIMDPLYMAVSLTPDFDPTDKSDSSKLIEKAVLPVCRELNLPFAMMIGVKRKVNPGLRVAGDGVGKANIEAIEGLCRDNPHNKFLVTFLSRENQHELCIAARKFGNLMPFGCWWFLNDPHTIDEMTRMRLELLGLSFIPQHSDARVLDQVIYKWAHSRWLIALVLQDKYGDLFRTGWHPTEEEIDRDVQALFGNNFKHFIGQPG